MPPIEQAPLVDEPFGGLRGRVLRRMGETPRAGIEVVGSAPPGRRRITIDISLGTIAKLAVGLIALAFEERAERIEAAAESTSM